MNTIMDIISRIENIETKLDRIIDILEKNTENCNKMSSHIDFIEAIYDNVKNPLGYICEKIKTISGNANHSITP
tara:strand:- start:1507 stop:1728 length:222 start_codon:yes stop_codon:yes gene_type:complete